MLKYLIILFVVIFASIAYEAGKRQIVTYHEEGVYTLPVSKFALNVPANYRLLLGKESIMERENSYDYDSKPEATILSKIPPITMQFEQVITYEYADSGHLDNKNVKLDAERILEKIIKNTEENNLRFSGRRKGDRKVYVQKWIEEPKYDQATNTLTGVLEVKNTSSQINCIAIRSTRVGYEKIVGIFTQKYYRENPDIFNQFVKSLEVPSGERYEDFVPGDRESNLNISKIMENQAGLHSSNFQEIFRIIMPSLIWIMWGGIVVYALNKFWRYCNEDDKELSQSV